MVRIAIDPGKNGSIAYHRTGEKFITVEPVTITAAEYQSQLTRILNNEAGTLFIEHVAMRPEDLLVPGKAFGIQRLIQHQKMLITVSTLQGLKIIQIMPHIWMKYLVGLEKGETQQQRKSRILAKVIDVCSGKDVRLEKYQRISKRNADSIGILIYSTHLIREQWRHKK